METKGYFKEGKPIVDIYLEGSKKPLGVLVDTEKIEELSLTFIGDTVI